VSGDQAAPSPEVPVPYLVIFSRQARRNLHENLPLDGYYSARRGTYRIIYRINEEKHTAEIHSIRHRRDAYRT
jgi:mRNA interferase RelE/StbE